MKHIARICLEFIKAAKEAKKPWWFGKLFRHPATGNKVKFKSLPLEEQRRLNARFKRKQEKSLKRAERRKRRDERRLERQKKLQERKHMTPESHPNFFTNNGKKLNTTRGMFPGVKVSINPEWDPETDNAYYAKQIHPRTGHAVHFYTEDYIKRHNKIKFANVQRFGELLPTIRKKYHEDLKSANERDRVYATAIALVDQAAMRVGNKKSEKDDVRGLHNLQKKHITFTDHKVTVSYTGKKKIAQKHTFEVSDTIKNNLQQFLENKQPDDALFTWKKRDEEIRIAPRLVNEYLRMKLGSNVTIHHFRHHHGTQWANEYLARIDASKMSRDQVKQTINDAAVIVAERLGNTPKIAMKHYIDPTIFQNFYARAGMKMRANAENVSKTAADKDTTHDDFLFKVTDLEGLTPEEQKFHDDLWAIKLEDLQPYEDIKFEDGAN